ncbi:MAG: Ig-like domain-containing protein [Shinella sp.]|nr:Ig-like domain-containing protein [Shinella sp.]
MEPDHTWDATFSATLTSGLALIDNIRVVLQVQDANGQWVNYAGSGSSSGVLDLIGVTGQTASFGVEDLPPGVYRAVATSTSLAGLFPTIVLDANYTDTDFTEIGSIETVEASGNVITDVNENGQSDTVTATTVVGSVDGQAVGPGGLTVQGDYGSLTINQDGSYTYTPGADAGGIGRVDQFEYTLIDPETGNQATANLYIEIDSESADLVWGETGQGASTGLAAGDNAATAGVLYENVVVEVPAAEQFEFNTGIGILIPATGSGSGTFTVDADTVSDITVYASSSELLGLSVFPSFTISIVNQNGTTVGTISGTALANLPLGIGPGISLPVNDLPPGTYTINVSSTNTLGLGYDTVVQLEQTVTHLTDFQVDTVTATEGNLLDNDTLGSTYTRLLINDGSGYVEVGNDPITIAGDYGTLTVDKFGNYNYEPSTSLSYYTEDQVDTFSYQLRHPNGDTVTAELAVTVDVSDPGAALFTASVADTQVYDDVVPLPDFEGSFASDGEDGSGGPSGGGDAVALEDILTDGGEDEPPIGRDDDGGPGSTAGTPEAVDDPLGYLPAGSGIDPDEALQQHAVL